MSTATPHIILIVDDDPLVLSALRRLLLREGYRVLAAASGTEGLELLRNNEVSLIISDQRMPVVIGAEFLARARLISPYSMRIMLTGYSEVETLAQAINEGGIHFYCSKPWDDGQLRLVVRQLFDHRLHPRAFEPGHHPLHHGGQVLGQRDGQGERGPLASGWVQGIVALGCAASSAQEGGQQQGEQEAGIGGVPADHKVKFKGPAALFPTLSSS
ncbi:MAG: response regulator [Candidatus Latescibacteria bacterium]|nr:response regulator [Candidatus Latescibacterota bacterium]